MSKSTLYIILGGIALIGVVAFTLRPGEPKFGAIQLNGATVATTGNQSVTSGNTLVVAVNTGRRYLAIRPVSDNIFCSLGGTSALNKGLFISATNTRPFSFEVDNDGLIWGGDVSCIAQTSSTYVAFVQY